MASALLLLAVGAAAAPADAANPLTAGLADLFIRACIEGEVRLTRDAGRPIGEDKIGYKPSYARREVTQARYYEIFKPGPAMLQVIDWAPGHRLGWAKTCHLGSYSMDLNSSWKYVTKAVFGRESRRIPRARIYRLDVPARGYTLRVSEGSLRTVIYDKPTAEKMLADWRRRGSKPAVPVAETSVCVSELLCA